MSRKLGILLALSSSLVITAAILAGCSGDSVKPEDQFAPPTLLVIKGVGTSGISVEWAHSPDRTLDNFQGYIVYWNPGGSLSSRQPPFGAPVDSIEVSKTEHEALITGLSQTTKYFIHVRALKSNGDLSRGTNEVNAAPRPEGTGSIYEKASAVGNNSAFDFSEGINYSFVWENATHCDVYLGTSQASDGSGDLYLKSPDQVQGTGHDWSSRTTSIKDLGSADRAGFDALSTTTNTAWQTKAAVIANHVYAIKTPDNHYAKVWVTNINAANPPNRTITFTYAYQTIENYPSFSPRKP